VCLEVARDAAIAGKVKPKQQTLTNKTKIFFVDFVVFC
jgi:hypothetical protein